jgi:hypothetical protein
MKLRDLLKQIGRGPQNGQNSSMSDTDVMSLIRYLENCELDCEQVFSALDQYAEIEVRHEDAAKLMPLVREHLDMCHDCCDEYEALLDVLVKESKQ